MELYAVQFHPEVHAYRKSAQQMLNNFLFEICGCAGDWTDGLLRRDLRRAPFGSKSADGRVLCGLSGGVDSSVAAVLVAKAVGSQLTCIFVDQRPAAQGRGGHGGGYVPRDYYDLNFVRVNAGGSVPHPLGWGGRAGEEAQDHRRGVYSGLRGRGCENRPGGFSGTGHHLSRCH